MSPIRVRLVQPWPFLISWCAIFCAIAGCDSQQTDDRPLNIVVFVIDTLRADHLGAYGYDRATSPAFDSLAGKSLLFERAYSPAPWTLPSVVSILTSVPPCEHRVLVDRRRLGPEITTWAERLQARDYHTVNFYANPYAGKASGLDRGFDRVAQVNPGRKSIDRWLIARKDEPFFLYLHSVEPHDPYHGRTILDVEESIPEVPPGLRDPINRLLGKFRKLTRVDWEEDRPPGTTDTSAEQDEVMQRLAELQSRVLSLYDTDIRTADLSLASVVIALAEADLWNDTIFVVTSDHGEEFGDHGGWQHDQSLYDELVHVPLLIHLPDGRMGGRRIQQPISLLDLMPTVLDAAGLHDLAREGPGQSWWSWIEGKGDPPASPVRSVRENLKKYYAPFKLERGDRNVAWVEDGWKLIWNEEPETFELYHLEADPDEVHDRSSDEPERAQAMARKASAWLAECGSEGDRPIRIAPIDEADEEQLRALGYVD